MGLVGDGVLEVGFWVGAEASVVLLRGRRSTGYGSWPCTGICFARKVGGHVQFYVHVLGLLRGVVC